MGRRPVSKGKCEGCGAIVAKSAMSRHLAGCQASLPSRTGKLTSLVHLVIDAPYATQYWLHVRMPARTTLATLDDFLRDIWLECCGHMSAFTIGGVSYTSAPTGMGDERPMGQAVGPLVVSSPWKYEYDFGSTTHLRIQPVGVIEGAAKKVELLARNLPPDIPCEGCGAPATRVCTVRSHRGGGGFCDACLEKHECGRGSSLPVVNSPRVGVCGYEG